MGYCGRMLLRSVCALKALNGIEITDDTDVEDILKAALKNMAFM